MSRPKQSSQEPIRRGVAVVTVETPADGVGRRRLKIDWTTPFGRIRSQMFWAYPVPVLRAFVHAGYTVQAAPEHADDSEIAQLIEEATRE